MDVDSSPAPRSRRVRAPDEPLDRDYQAFYLREVDGQVRRAFLLLGWAAAAHDVVADAFIEVYQRWDRIDQPGPYLHRCVLNGCRDYAGRRWRTDRSLGSEPGAEVVPASQSSGFGTVELAQALSRLPFRQRAAIVLRYYGRENEREIAERLGCQPGTVGSLIHRGLAKLREELA